MQQAQNKNGAEVATSHAVKLKTPNEKEFNMFNSTIDIKLPALNSGALTMSSRELAELCKKQHDNVLRDIRGYITKGILKIEETPYIHPQNGQLYVEFLLNKRDSLLVVSGYDAKLRAKIIDRWIELEEALSKPSLPDLSTHTGTLLALRNLTEQTITILAERDQAIATKAQIGSKREATAMARASKAVRKADELSKELGRHMTQATIIAVQTVTGKEYNWRFLKRWCEEQGIKAVEVFDPRWGKVKAWPAVAWLAVFGIDLSALFKPSVTE